MHGPSSPMESVGFTGLGYRPLLQANRTGRGVPQMLAWGGEIALETDGYRLCECGFRPMYYQGHRDNKECPY